MASNKTEASARSELRRRRRMRQLLGAGVCALVVIGFISTISGSIKFVENLFDDTEEKKAFEARLEHLVALDPLPFDTLADANTGSLLSAAISVAISGANSEDYEHDEVGAMYMPTADIEKSIASLYGPEVKFNYATFDDHGVTFTYVPEKQAYLLPITSAVTDYRPIVQKIKREGKIKRVTVGYDSPYDDLDASVKYNDYLFTKSEDGIYYLTAIVASSMKVEPGVAVSSTVAPDAGGLPPQGADVLDQTQDELLKEARAASEAAAPVAQAAAPVAQADEAAAQDGAVADDATADDSPAEDDSAAASDASSSGAA